MKYIKISLFLISATIFLIPFTSYALDNNTSSEYQSIVRIKQMGFDLNRDLVTTNYGSGVWVSKNLILTSAHVVTLEDFFGTLPSILKISLVNKDGEVIEAGNGYVVGYDKIMDIALVYSEIEQYSEITKNDFQKHKVSKLTKKYSTGQSITVSGFPAIGGASLSTTQGRLSGQLKLGNLAYLKSDATVGYGSSGSPVFNKKNEIVGLVTNAGSDLTGGQVGYILPSKNIIPWFKKIKSKQPEKTAEKTMSEQIEYIDKWFAEYFSDLKNSNKRAHYTMNFKKYPALRLDATDKNWKVADVSTSSLSLLYEVNDMRKASINVSFTTLPFNPTINYIKNINLDDDPRLIFTELTINELTAVQFVQGEIVYYAIPYRNFIININYVSLDKEGTNAVKEIIDSLSLDDSSGSLAPTPVVDKGLNGNFNFTFSRVPGWEYISSSRREVALIAIYPAKAKNLVAYAVIPLSEAQRAYTLKQWENELKTGYGSAQISIKSDADYTLSSGVKAVKIEAVNEKIAGLQLYTLRFLIPINGAAFSIVYDTYDKNDFEAFKSDVEKLVQALDLRNFRLPTKE